MSNPVAPLCPLHEVAMEHVQTTVNSETGKREDEFKCPHCSIQIFQPVLDDEL